MPRLRNGAELQRLLGLLAKWEIPRAISWEQKARNELYAGCELSVEEINEGLYLHASNDGEINRVEEQAPPHQEMHDCFYEFRIKVQGHRLYVKMRMMRKGRPRSGPELFVVSLHYDGSKNAD